MRVDPTAAHDQVSPPDTFPKLLLHRAEHLGDRDASRDNGGIDVIGPFRINQIPDEGVVDQELSLIEADKKKYNWKKIK